ncbi:MAG TPA: GntR family transcriptional regulator [bacterium]|nr:GntR family transcriptional regulator [bacterium]
MEKQLLIEFEEVVPKYYQIEKHIKALIFSGKLKTGDKIPPEEILSKQLNVNRGTVAKAINRLVNEGVLYRKRGKGTFITPYKMKKTKTLAVVLYHIDNPFYSKIVKGIEKTASEKGYHLILCNSLGDEEKEQQYVERLIDEGKVDGFLLCPKNLNLTSPIFEILEERNIPVVVFPQASRKENRHNISYVISDDNKGACNAVRYLIRLGHRKIGFVADKDWKSEISGINRWNGYKKAMEENKIEVNPEYIIEASGVEIEDGWNLAAEKLETIKKFTALFCTGDMLAIGILKKLKEEGIKVPEEISIVGFDNIDMAGYPDIQLTTVEQPTYLIGQKATEILIEHIEGRIKDTVHILLPTKLIIRKTTTKINRECYLSGGKYAT